MKQFVPIHLKRQLFPVEYTKPGKDDNDIVTYVRKQKVQKVGDGEDDYIIKEVVVEESRVNRQAYIAKDAADVGVMNILEKVRRSGDLTLFNQTHNVFEASGELDSLGRPLGTIQDYTDLPSNVGEALNAVQSGAASFAGLKEIFPNVTFEQLASMSAEDVAVAVDAYTKAHTVKPVEEGGNE